MRSSDWSSDVGSSDLTRIGIVREAVALGRKIFEFGLLGTGQIACDADRCDGGTLGHRFIETKRLGPARQARKMLESADEPAGDGHVAIEMKDRKSAVMGKSVSVRLCHGGRTILKQKK